MQPTKTLHDIRPIVFIDGHCVLCSGFSTWLVDHDTQLQFRLGALQGATARKLIFDLIKKEDHLFSTILLFEDGHIYDRSTAVLKIFSRLATPWHYLGLFLWLPQILRDFVYDWVARNRYSWFGRHDVCRLPTVSDKTRLVD